MLFFFLFAGMEIKRELLIGELSGFKKGVMPFAATLGGIIVEPALIYLLFNIHTAFQTGGGYLLQQILHFFRSFFVILEAYFFKP